MNNPNNLNNKSYFLSVFGDEKNVRNAEGIVERPLRAVRDKIYWYAFVSEDYLGANARQTPHFKKHMRHLWQESFYVSSSQIYNEVRPILLGENGFEFNFIKPFWGFLQIIGTEGRKLVRKLRFNFCGVSEVLNLNHATFWPSVYICLHSGRALPLES